MVGLEEFGDTLGSEGKTEMEQWTVFEVPVKQKFSNACLMANSLPFLSHRTEEEEEEEEGKEAGISIYAASSPLTNSPCALWHRQSCWLCYCWLLTTMPEQQAGPVCLE